MEFNEKQLSLFFPTPVWSATIQDHEALNARIREQLEPLDWGALEEENRKEFKADHTFREDRFITVDQVPATTEVLDGFLRLCHEITEQMCWDIGEAEMRVTTYWYHVTEARDVTQVHTHKPGLLSGVYYVDKPADAGHIVFIDENPYHSYLPRPKRQQENPLIAAEVTVPAEEGTMIVFPSWLQHRVQRNESGRRRVSISFNASPLLNGPGV